MADKKSSPKQVEQSELNALLSVLKADPLLFDRVKEVVELSQHRQGQSTRIEAVEDELVARINKLGQQTLSSFGEAVEHQQLRDLRSQHNGIQQREKKR